MLYHFSFLFGSSSVYTRVPVIRKYTLCKNSRADKKKVLVANQFPDFVTSQFVIQWHSIETILSILVITCGIVVGGRATANQRKKRKDGETQMTRKRYYTRKRSRKEKVAKLKRHTREAGAQKQLSIGSFSRETTENGNFFPRTRNYYQNGGRMIDMSVLVGVVLTLLFIVLLW
jgi:hypothetical protein